MSKICEKSLKCPIYNGILKSNEMMIQTYKELYCDAGQENHNKCIRYQVAKIIGYCPSDILPNSYLSVEDIIKKVKLQEEEELKKQQ